MLYWNDGLESYGSSEEDRIKKECVDIECVTVDIQPWYKGPYSIRTTFVAAGPIWKVDYIPIET